MKSYEATAVIEAPQEAIWAILTDAPGLSQWDSGVERVEGRIAPGQTIKVFSKVSPRRAFPVATGLKTQAVARSRVSTGISQQHDLD